MKKLSFFILILAIVYVGCKKTDTPSTTNQDNILSDKTIVVSNDVINSSLIAVDSTKLTFTASGSGVDKVKVGSILVSDISSVAPVGFLRKVTGVSIVGSNKVFTTEQASLTDAIVKGKVSFNRVFSDNDILDEDSSGIDISAQQRVQGLSFTFNYTKIMYDADGNSSTTYDQIKVNGEMKLEPTFDFELDINGSTVNKFVAKINLKNTNKISAESKVVLASFNQEIVLKTFQLKPFTIIIAGVPVPIAKQWIAIILGVDGSLTARVTAGAQNINTAIAGISYQNNSWSTINTQDNLFSFQPLTFEGAAKVEPWLQVRYEIRPYGIQASRIYIGVRGSIIGEATIIPTGLNISLKWAVKFSAKAQMQIWNSTVLDYEQIFYEKEFPISQSTSAAIPTLTTAGISNLSQTTSQSGGTISSDGGATVTARGVCWNTLPNPTISDYTTSNGSGLGAFTSSLTGLIANTTYFLRAYATNSAGTGYGNEVSFTTQPVSTTLPTITTSFISGITLSSAQSGGTIASDGGSPVTAKGVCWSTSQNPTILNYLTANGSGIGSFSSNISGLSANTTYYVRAYATNSVGTGYGNQLSFSTAVGSLTDIDGNVYTTVTIGTQIWMVENLKTTRYRNGDVITSGLSNSAWQSTTSGAYSVYNNDPANNTTYGKIYNWYAVVDQRGICPTGWHIPSISEFTTLSNYLGGMSIAGGKMKEIGLVHWASPNTGATNSSGFTDLPGGFRYYSGSFSSIGIISQLWTSTEGTSILAHATGTASNSASLGFSGGSGIYKTSGSSCRCIKD